MGLWGVLIDMLKSAATQAAPHVAKSAVDMARERMSAGETRRTAPPDDQVSAALRALNERLSLAEQRVAATEELLTAAQTEFSRQWRSARLWILILALWNLLLSMLLLYVMVRGR